VSNSIVLVRHGETEWSRAGRHTSRTDVGLTERGKTEARNLEDVLARRSFALVLSSPRRRARETAALAGFADPIVDDDLVEWDYGAYEGRTTAEIRADRPDWNLWHDGAPEGESAEHVAARADRIIARAAAADGDTLVFAHAHFLRVVGARWLGLDTSAGRYFYLDSGSISWLAWQREQPVLGKWNVTPSALL
jgi:probable phosphoglycerate mutase